MTAGTLHTLSVAVLMGGWSAEREISLKSGVAVLAALGELGLDCWGVDAGRDLAAVLDARRPDVAFVALHGRGGEDGAVQGLLEVLGIPCTGSGVLASALCMNKKFSKWLFQFHGLPTPESMTLRRNEPFCADDIPFGLPAVVKPLGEGSTIGLTVVREAGDLEGACRDAFAHGPEILVERYVEGRELTVGVLGRRPLPAVEIIPEGGIYDYRAKYQSNRTSYVVPAETGALLGDRLAALAVEAASLLDCRGAVRVDFRVDSRDEPFLLEVNTIPGLTQTSLLPKAAAAAGMSFADLVGEMVREAVERQ